MDITKDEKLDIAYVRLRKGIVHETIELRPGILLDLDKKGEVLGMEVLSLSKLAPALVGSTKRKRKKMA